MVFSAYMLIIASATLVAFFYWRSKSPLRGHRKQILIMLILTTFVFPVILLSELIIPIFTAETSVPLAAIALLVPSILVYFLIRKYRAFGITVANISKYIFSSVAIPSVVLNHDNTISLENQAAVNFFRGSIKGRKLSEFILPDTGTQGELFFKDTFKDRTVMVNTLSGIRICNMVLTIEHDKYNDAIFKVAVLMDITDEKETTERLSLMLDTSPLCAQIWSRDFRIVDCNEAGVRLYGFKDKQEYRERFMECCSPEYQPDGQRSDEKAAALVNKAFEEGISEFDWMHQMPDGTPIPAEITLVRVKYGADDVVVGYTRDVRDFKKMMAVIENKDNLLQAINKAAGLLLISDVESFDTTLGQAMSVLSHATNTHRMLIWKNREIDGKLHGIKVHEWIVSDDIPSVNTDSIVYSDLSKELTESLQSGQCINGFVSSMSPEIQDILSQHGVLSIIMIPIFMNDEFWGFISLDDYRVERIFSTEEEVLLRSGGMLFANAISRNEMVQDMRNTSSQLESALVQATAASKAKGDFLSNMSHEIRTPLNAIIGMTAIGKKAVDLTDVMHTLNKIGSASSHLLGIINDILDMAKIEADKIELAPIRYNFENMVQKVLTVVRFRADEKQQILSVDIDKDVPRFIIGDEQRLSQVITNLLSNAVKFTTKGGSISFKVSVSRRAGEYYELLIEVADDGIGISPDQQEKMFKAFEQADSGTSREYGGTGLGLAISKRIIELMGGRIWIESELGKGAKFIFTVHVECGGTNENYPEESAYEKTVADKSIFIGKRLLVVEDVEINQEILLALLEDSGLIIDCAENGKEALDMIIAEPEKYDIVFMDLQMPQMDGLEATRRIRALPVRQRSRLPIVAMTANVFKEDIDACLEAGMDDHLGKPLDIEKVFETLHKYLTAETNPG